jgi:hypothetical protein
VEGDDAVVSHHRSRHGALGRNRHRVRLGARWMTPPTRIATGPVGRSAPTMDVSLPPCGTYHRNHRYTPL